MNFDKYKLADALVENIKGREMPFNIVTETFNSTSEVIVLSSTVSLRPDMTYEDLAEELVTQLKKLVSNIFPNYFEVPTLLFPEYMCYDEIEVYKGQAVIWFIPCMFEQEPFNKNFKRHIADNKFIKVN